MNNIQKKAHEEINILEESLPQWVRGLMIPGKPFGRCKFHYNQKQDWLLYASQQMYSLVITTGVIKKFHNKETSEWVELFFSLQDPQSGLFRCPVVPKQGDDYFRAITMKLIRRLKSQGISPNFRPPQAEKKCPPLKSLRSRMEALPVDEHPYQALSPIGAWAVVRAQELEAQAKPLIDDSYLQTICMWLEDRQNTETGFWSKSSDLTDSMNGFFKCLPVYEIMDREIPGMEKVMNSVLFIQKNENLFNKPCSAWNNMSILNTLSRRLEYKYRKSDIADATHKIISDMCRLKQPDGFYSASEHGCLEEHAGVKLCNHPYPIGDIQGNAHAWDILNMALELLERTG